MRSVPVSVETHTSLADAARAVAASRGAKLIAGGTVLMRAVNEADPDVQRLVRVADPALARIAHGSGGLTLGAAVTMAQLLRSREAAFLHPVARVIGGPQVRAAATVAGNLFAPPPYGDFAAALLALGAGLEFTDGRRQGIDDFRPGDARQLVSAIHVGDPRGAFRFAKVTRVRPKGVSVMSIAALLPLSGGRVENPRIAFNGMGERPVRATAAERALHGQPLERATIERAAAVAAENLSPQDDALASAWYRREVAGVHLKRLLAGAR